MILEDVRNNFQKHYNSSEYAYRILSEWNYAVKVSAANGGKYDALVEQAADALNAAIAEDGVITKSTALKVEEMLMPMQADAKKYRVHCVSHAHIDMNWMWGFQETVSVTVDTFRTVLDLMNEYPELTFAQSQASTYEIIEKYAPSMIEEIKARVKEGRWEVSASTWTETDKNMPCGESLARHILYTKKYLSKLLDIDPDSLKLDFEPDTFGHNISVPEICLAGGVKYYYHCRGNDRPDNIYRWRGRAGAELLVFREADWYNATVEPAMFYNMPLYCSKFGIDCWLNVYGVGDHGGGPTRRDVETIMKAASWPIMPTIIFSTYGAFFGELEKYRENLPIIEGELNFLFNGCYTSQSKIKMANRIAEDRIYESEAISTASALLGGDDFTASFRQAWKNILFNHFHDILPGSGISDTREYAMGRFQDSMASVGTSANCSMRNIAKMINTESVELEADPNSISQGGGVGLSVGAPTYYHMPCTERGMGKIRLFHFFNSTQYDYDGIVEFTVFDWDYDVTRAVFKSADGEVAEFKVLENGTGYWGHKFKKFALRAKIPAFGYASYTLDLLDSVERPMALSHQRTEVFTNDDIVLENDKVRAVFIQDTMQLKSFVDKKSGKEFIFKPACAFDLIMENPVHRMTSWRVGETMSETVLNEAQDVHVTDKNTSGVRKWIRYDLKFANSKIKVLVKLDDNSSMLNFDVTLDFHEIGNAEKGIPQVAFNVPFAYESDICRYDVPFGIIDREAINADVPANSFAVPLAKDGGASLMLISDSKYGFKYANNAIALDLIRASYDPDPYPEEGLHYMRLGVGICEPSDNNADIYRTASEFVHPISFCAANYQVRGGELALDGQFLKADGDIKITAIKLAEDASGAIIRFCNPDVKATNYTLTFAKAPAAVCKTDINENVIADVAFDGKAVSGTCAASEICTLLFKF